MSFETELSPLIKSQFPAFYKEGGDGFLRFVKAYYEWMESEGQVTYHTRRLNDYHNFDITVEEFVDHFREKYLYGISHSNIRDPKFIYSHVKDFLSTKGTESGVDLLFRMIFNEEVKVYYPSSDLLRPSDGEFYVPVYLELAPSTRAQEFQNRQITGAASGATAIVEKVIRKGIRSKFIDVAYLTNVRGDFQTGEIVTDNGVIEGAPHVVGSLTDIDLNLPGASFEVGDIAEVTSNITGRKGRIRIKEVETATGRVTFTLVDGGWGFTSDPLVYVSERVLNIENRINANTEVTDFNLLEILEQPFATINYTNNNAVIAIGSFVKGVNTSSTNTGTGHVVGLTNVSGANGTIKVIVETGTFTTASDIANTTANVAIVSSYTNSTAYGLLIGSNSESIGLYGVTGTFSSNNYNFIRGLTSNTYANIAANGIATGTGATFDVGSIQDTEVVYLNTDLINSNNQSFQPYLDIVVNGENSNVGYVSSVTINSGGTGYTNGYLTLTGGAPTTPANISFSTNSTGGIISTTIVEPGSGYNTPPTITISGGTGANLTSNMVYGYGFPKSVMANLNTVIATALSKNTYTIGEIASLTNINPGSGYNQDPFVLVIEPLIAGFNRRDLILGINNVTGTFEVGENITQEVSVDGYTVSYNAMSTSVSSVNIISGGANYVGADTVNFSGGGGSGAAAQLQVGTLLNVITVSGNFVNGEVVTQATTAANGTIFSANSSVVKVLKNSGNFSNGYIITGATSNTTANVDTYSNGVIFAINLISGGSGYTSSPSVNITTSTGTAFSGNTSLRGFQIGEGVTQGTSTGVIDTVSQTNSIAGNILIRTEDVFAANATTINTSIISVTLNVDNSPFVVGERVNQQNTGAYGTAFSSNSTILRLVDVDGIFVVGNSTHGKLYGEVSGILANVSSVGSSVVLHGSNTVATILNANTQPTLVTTKGIVTSVGDDYIGIERRSFSIAFEGNNEIVGSMSGATANVTTINQNTLTNPIGFNAVINAVAGTVVGSISDFEVIDSGFAYEELESISIEKEGSDFIASGFARLQKQGTGAGYFRSERGYLNTKYLHDSDYYQEFSYVIKTGLALEKYQDMLKKVMHVAGTKLFGEFDKNVNANVAVKTITINTGTVISNNSNTILYED